MRRLHIVWVVLILFSLQQWLIAHHPEKTAPVGIGALLLLIGFEILHWAKVLGIRVDRQNRDGTADTMVFGLHTVIAMSVLGAMIAVGGFIFLSVGYLFYVLF